MSAQNVFPRQDHDHDRCVAVALHRAERLCAERGVRLTELRRQVLLAVWESHAPIGAYDILDRLAALGRRAAPITVYRALDFLISQGLVHRLASRNAFIGCGNPESPHSGQFLICTDCGTVAEIEERAIRHAIVAGASRAGFDVGEPVVEVAGLCPDCRR